MTSFRQGLVIARREFVERVRSKWFLVVTVLGPLGMLLLMLVPAWLSSQGAQERVRIEVLDQSGHEMGQLYADVLMAKHGNFKVELIAPDSPVEPLLERIRKKELEGYLIIPKNVLEGGAVVYRGDNATNLGLQTELTMVGWGAAIQARARSAGLTDKQVAMLVIPVPLDARHTTGEGEGTSAMASVMLGYIVMFVLYMSILLYGANVLRSVVMEKTNRVVEMIVSCARSNALLVGKLVGVGGVGIVQLGLWALVALVLFKFQDQVVGLFGLNSSNLALPDLAPSHLLLSLLFFLLGFFFYSSLFAAVGAMVSSEEEAQQAQTPLVLVLILPGLCVNVVADAPRGSLSALLTQIPFTSPVLMPTRIVLDAASPGEIFLSLAILSVCLVAGVALAGKIYRVGILMHGKRPSFSELRRWLSYK